jgi:tetratricopeptide (TPR) repeat protein
LGHDVLASSEPNSIVFITGDTSAFNSHYVYYTTGAFGDRKLIKTGSLKFIEYRKQLANLYPDLQLPVNFLTDQNKQGVDYMVALIMTSFDKFPIYSSGFSPDIEAHKWFSVGLLKKLFKTDGDSEEIVSNLNKSAFSRLKFDANSASSGYSNFMTDHLKEIYYYSIVDVADSLISINRPDEAINYLDKAKSIFANKKDVYIRMGNIFFSKKDCNSSLNYFNQAFSLDKKDWQILIATSKVYKECLNNNDLSEYFLKQAEDLKGITKNFKGF